MKVKVNVGCSSKADDVEIEKKKIEYAVARRVDYVSEISLVPSQKQVLLEFIDSLTPCSTRFCTVPLYDCVLTKRSILDVMKEQFSYGISCFTLHLTPRFLIDEALAQGFVINSRAGNFLTGFAKRGLENPHFEAFSEIMSFIRENKCELFVGTSLRPGRVAESKKSTLWLQEIKFIQSFLKEQGVAQEEYILECGGHVDASQIDTFVEAIKDDQICVMGPLLTDATNGMDDLSSIVGATLLHSKKTIHTHLLLTRDEHIRLPTLDALKSGVDTVLVLKHNLNLSKHDSEAVRLESRFQNQSNQCTTGVNLFGPLEGDPMICTMCGFHCPLRNIRYPSIALENVLPKIVQSQNKVAQHA